MKNPRRVILITGCAVAAVAAAGAADLVVEHKVERRVAETAACRLDAKDVSVDLADTLAGLRTLTGSVGTVHVSAEGVRRQGTELSIDASLHDVSTDGGSSGGTATATVPYAGLGGRLPDDGGDLKPGTDGTHLTLTGTAGAAGIPVTVVTDLSTTSHTLTVTPASVDVFGRDLSVQALSALPGASQLADRLKPRTVDIGSLPAGTVLTGAHAGDAGLALEFRLSPDTGKTSARGSAAAACTAGGRTA
ncbi:hypothetical protein ACFV0T_04120 [Streptomyces sp. NPDC059582]|uniref:hypothetical protein n=1 Tax=Streptomyces sp. NPDC059582 TaxID=3346875 RepID=UPI0036BC2245